MHFLFKIKKYYFIWMTLLFCCFNIINSKAQNSTPDTRLNSDSTAVENVQNLISPFYIHTQLKSMHLWRGIAVTNAAMFALDGGISTKDNKLKVGIWGGYGIDGIYKEFDYYVAYKPFENFNIEVWDILNYSENATWNNAEFFNYNARETGRFVDVRLTYMVSKKFPLNIFLGTVVFGRDRGMLNYKNLYSNYTELSYPILQNKPIDVRLEFGVTYALSPERENPNFNFLSPKTGVANVGVVLAKKFSLGNYILPVSLYASWSPVNDAGNLQLAFDLF